MIHEHLTNRLPEISELCLLHKVSKLYAFGSVVDGRFKIGKSDIDLLIEFDETNLTKIEISKSLLLLWIEFQKLLQSNVDLISTSKLKGKYFKKYLDMYKIKIFDICNSDELKVLNK